MKNKPLILGKVAVTEEAIAPETHINLVVGDAHVGERVDKFMPQRIKGYSRTFFQQLIAAGLIKLNGSILSKDSVIIKYDDNLEIQFPPERKRSTSLDTSNSGIEIVSEHEHFLIINKPAGLLTHPASPVRESLAVTDWLSNNYLETTTIGYAERPGIIHRLDRETSGLLIIPRTNFAFNKFGYMFRQRTIEKTYQAVVKGHPDREGTIEFPIGRHPTHRNRMMHANDGRASFTSYRVLEYFSDVTLVEAKPKTGRTHQIRVHFSELGYPLLGDPIYGSKSKRINRHALHAYSLEFEFEKNIFKFQIDPPEDFNSLLKSLQKTKPLYE